MLSMVREQKQDKQNMIKFMNQTEHKEYVQESNLIRGIVFGLLISVPIWLAIIMYIFIF